MNIFILAFPLNVEHLETSDHLFASWLRNLGLESKKPDTHHQVPLLTSGSPYSIPHNQSYSKSINLKLSDYFVPGWADTRWQYRKNITIDHLKVSGDLTNFPLYIELFDSDLQNDAQASGNDILFTNASGHILDHEIEIYQRVYNSTHAHLVAWVKVNLSSSQDTILSMYYGNPTAVDQSNPSSVWDGSYEFVLHMNQDPSSSNILDSTSNEFDFMVEASSSMTSDDLVDGQTGYSLAFDGVDDYLYLPISEGFNGPTDRISFEFWIMFPNGGPGSREILAGPATSAADPYVAFYDNLEFHVETTEGVVCDSTQNSFSAGIWYHIVGLWDGTGAGLHEVYINGILDGEDITPLTGTHVIWNTLSIGAEDDDADGPGGSATDREIHATVSEFRLSNNIWSADWISTGYENQQNPSSFYLIDSEERYTDTTSWHFSGLKYRKELIINATKVSGSSSLLNFPVLIDLYDSDLHDTNKVQADGDDILFCDAMGRKLDHEIDLFNQNYNPTQAHLVAWVKVPSLSSIQDTPIFMYFGNSDLYSQENPSRVWESGYVGVWHLSESSGDALDSTFYKIDGTINSGATQGEVGQIDGAYDFDGTNSGVTIGNPSDGHLDFGTESFSISFWINIDQSTGTYQIPVYKGGTTTSSEGYEVETNTVASALEFGISDGLGNRENRQIPIDFDEWIYFTGIVDRTTDKLHVYKNGGEVGTAIDISSVGSIDNDYIMCFSQASNPFDGILDEVRISATILSNDWILTEYNNQYNPSAFYSVNSLETRGNWTIPYLRYQKDLTIDHSIVSGSGDLNNFPLLLDFYDSDLHEQDKVQSDGDDIVFTDSNGVKLEHEIELFDQTGNGTHAHLLVWIKIPTLSASTDTIIKMWYGNSAITSLANPVAVWNNYGGVWHLSDDLIDSSGNNNAGTNYQSDDVSAHILDGRDFDGVDDYINTGSGSSIDNVFSDGATISAWIYPEGWGGYDYGRIMDKSASTAGSNGWVFCVDGESSPAANHHLLFYRDFSVKRGLWYSPEDSISLNQWQYVTVTYDESSTANWPNVYVNGVLQTLVREENPSGAADDDGAQSLYIGNYKDGGRTFDGVIDEMRICYTSLSTEWIQTEYTNQFNPENCIVSMGDEKSRIWVDSSFIYSKDIIINSTNVPEDLVNFPVLLDITDSGLKSGNVQSTGSDILFCDPYGRKLNHEIETFTQTSTEGHLIAWVRVPYLYSSDYTTITMYYRNNKLSEQQNPEGVWDFDYKGVWHLKEDPSSSAPQFLDSTSNDNDGSAVSLTTTNQVPGQIDGSLSFDDADRNVDIPDDSSLKLTFDIWISAWVKTTDAQADVDVVLAKWGGTPSLQNYFLGKLDTTTFSFYIDSSQHVDISLSKINDGDWHYVVGIADSTNNQLKLYVDGNEEGTASYDGFSVTGTSNLYIGQSPGAIEQEWNGGIDECRVSNVIRSNNWIATEYNNQYSPISFHLLATEFSLDVNPPLIVDFGAEDLGTGTGKYWANILDEVSGVQTVKIEINSTDHSMSFNGTLWIYQESVNYGGYYEFRIMNATDYRGNFLESASTVKYITFTEDFIAPNVIDWDYYPDEGEYGTFKANVTDDWGQIDTVIVNVTQGSVPIGNRWAVMQFLSPNYVNDTIIMNSGSIKFVIKVNDSAGNFYTSSEHQGYVPIVNHFPIAKDLTLSRSSTEILLPVYSNSTLYLNYTFYDQDGDSEGGTEIRWYKNGVRQTAYDNQKQVPSSALFKNDDWNATVKPKDGQDFGSINSSSTIIIQNTPPSVSGVNVLPGSPVTTSNLIISYTYSDNDGDSQNLSLREILWYKDTTLQTSLNNSPTVNSGNTSKNNQWYFKIRVSDSFNYSIWYTSNTITVANSVPSASSLQITPSNPKTSNNLVGSYTFTDLDSDTETGSLIRWYKNGVLQGSLNDSLVVNSSLTSKGENWYFTVQPSDGSGYGTLKTSSSISIVNTPPTASDLLITSIPMTGDNLEADWAFNDADGDTEPANSWIVRWYKNGVLVPAYNNLKQVPSSATAKGEVWNYTLKVYDGAAYSIQYNSSTTIILNTPPTATGVTITVAPRTTDDLVASWTFNDVDTSDTQSDWIIHWYKNGVLVPSYENLTTVLSSATTKGDVWNYTLKVSDGAAYSIQYNSSTITIINSAPTASSLTLTPLLPVTTNDILADWTFNDADGDSQMNFYINWTRGTTHQLAYDQLTTLPFSATSKNQIWYFTLIVNDGTANSTIYTSPSVEIQNTPPTASNITLTPINPNTSSTLFANWVFNDADPSDSESTLWIVRWYKNGVHQTAYDNQKQVPSSATAKNQNWNFTVKVYDGTYYSIQYNSSIITIQNSPPTVSVLTITQNPTTSNNLVAGWTAADVDGDNLALFVDQAIIRWYNWTGSDWEELLSAGNSTFLGSGNTTKGETWRYILRIYDGTNYSILYTSTNTSILNSIPTVTNPTFNKTSGVTTDDTINITYIFSDADGDLEDTVKRIVYWFNNSEYVPGKDNHTILYNTDTSPDEFWQYIIKVFDGTSYSQNYSSNLILITGGSQTNSPPEAYNIALSAGSNTTSDNLQASYSYYDPDGNLQTDFEIRWYKNGLLQSALNDLTTVTSSYTSKNEAWNFTLRVYDGLDWSIQYNSSLITIQNSIPEVSGMTIPSTPYTTNDLIIGWTFNDDDSGDNQASYNVKWFINGIYNNSYDNFTTILASETIKGEIWNYTLIVFDGEDYSIQYNSSITTILNTKPIASSVTLTTFPTTNSTLTVSYSYFDSDNDLENTNWIIYWYKDSILQPLLNHSKTVNQGNTSKNEFWYFTIQVFDGEEYSNVYTSPNRKILNTAPTLSSLTLTANPKTTDDLTADWSYTDVDGDTESTTRILYWYKNGVLQSVYNNIKIIPASVTTKGDLWNYTVKVYDGSAYSIQYNSSTTQILNSIPTASNLIVSISSPKTTDDLIAQWNYNDADNDPQNTSWHIRWYKSDILQIGLNDSLLVDSSLTLKDQTWYYTLEVYDGEEYSILYILSPQIFIINSVPSALDINLPTSPTTTDDLTATYTFSDDDNDSEPIGSWIIRWYRNGVNLPTYNDLKTVPSTATFRGEWWYYTLQVSDGTNASIQYSSPQIQIQNSLPSIGLISFNPSSPTSKNDLTVNYAWNDADTADSDSGTLIRWYRNDLLVSSYNDTLTIDSALLIKGDTWKVSILASDGIDYSLSWYNNSIVIFNAPPEVVFLTPEILPSGILYTTNDLIASWSEFDSDGDSISDIQIVWYRNLVSQPLLENYTTIPSNYTMKSDEWRFYVNIFDGSDWAHPTDQIPTWQWASATIANSIPYIENVTLTGGTTTLNDIVLSYDYVDADNDIEGLTNIEWTIFHLGTPRFITGSKILDSTEITAGDVIWCLITPHDGTSYGTLVDSSKLAGSDVLIQVDNSKPQFNTTLGYPSILSDHPNGTSIYNPQVPIYIDYANLVFDIDSGESDPIYDIDLEPNTDVQYHIVDRVIGAQYRWYKFNSTSDIWELQPELTKSFVDYYYLHRDEQWMGSVRPRDQYGYFGDWINSTIVEIGNSLPIIVKNSFSWLLPTPTTLDDLEFYFEYFDYDEDPMVASKTLILWLKNGEVIIGTENTSILYSSYFQKNDIIEVILRPFDGSDWALTNYTSPPIVIVNSPPNLISYTLAPTTISNLEVLALNWIFSDLDGDTEAFSQVYIRWYRNGVLRSEFTNQTFISLEETVNGDLWRADFQVSDGFSYSTAESVEIFTKKLTIDYVFDSIGQVDPNIRVDEFYVEDENLTISLSFESMGSVQDASIRWFTDQGNNTWLEVIEFENQTAIPSEVTFPGQKWYCSVIPFDGTYTWAHSNSSIISIESRPSIITVASEIVSVVYDREGHYLFTITVNDTRNPIEIVEYSLNDTIGGNRYAVEVPGTNKWTFDYLLTATQFHNLVNHLIIAEISIITRVNYGQIFDIYQTFTFNFTITDVVAPRVTNAFFTNNATNITFNATVQDYGNTISSVILYYYFEEASTPATIGLGSSLTQAETGVSMYVLNSNGPYSFIYTVTIPFDANGTDWKVIYRIATLDSAGNSNPRAFDVLRDDFDSVERNIIKYLPPGLPEWVLLVAGAVVFLIFIGAVVYVRFIRKPEIVGLDKELVLKKISDVTQAEVLNTMELHTIGIVVSFFDQRHGPIPIIVLPEILKDNFTKLVELSDRSFSSCGFADNFLVEIPSSYDFVLSQGIRISSLSYGYALERPSSRGGQENITLNILVHQDLFPLVESFKDEIKAEVHKIHLYMDKKEEEMDEINKMINNLREFISYIILSYENIYQTTELIKEEK